MLGGSGEECGGNGSGEGGGDGGGESGGEGGGEGRGEGGGEGGGGEGGGDGGGERGGDSGGRAAKESGEIAIIHLREPGRRGGGGTESYRGPPGSGHTRSAEAGLRIGFRPQGW